VRDQQHDGGRGEEHKERERDPAHHGRQRERREAEDADEEPRTGSRTAERAVVAGVVDEEQQADGPDERRFAPEPAPPEQDDPERGEDEHRAEREQASYADRDLQGAAEARPCHPVEPDRVRAQNVVAGDTGNQHRPHVGQMNRRAECPEIEQEQRGDADESPREERQRISAVRSARRDERAQGECEQRQRVLDDDTEPREDAGREHAARASTGSVHHEHEGREREEGRERVREEQARERKEDRPETERRGDGGAGARLDPLGGLTHQNEQAERW